jgi:UDP-2,3-diacylglucosamine pyrophosphatase LpxH
MVGNHDWFYHLPGDAYDKIRRSVVEATLLENPVTSPFSHDVGEPQALQLQQLFREHGVFARHGDIFDSFNYEGNRNESSLGDAIVVELLNRFPSEVKRQFGDELPPPCTAGLQEIDNVRPLLIIPVWMDGLLRRTCSPAEAEKIKDIWDGLVDSFLEIDFVKKHRSVGHLFGDLAKLEWALKFSRGVSLGNLSHLVTWIKNKLGVHDAPFYPNAFNEAAFKDRSAKFIVYGHTHNYEVIPLDSTVTPQGILNQAYINSGTWRAVHDLAQWRISDQEFMGYHVMAYVTFFKGDERFGRSFETWSGTLGFHGGPWS